MKFLKKSGFALVLLLSLCHCNKYSKDADLKAARDFIDAYYVMADQRKALEMTSDRAAEQIQGELKLLEGVENREAAYKTRDVVFDLKREEKTNADANYFYELKIIQPEVGDMKKMVHLVVDRQTGKIKDFRTVE